MPRVCDVTGKRTRFGNQVTRRGKSIQDGGVGLKTTGITRRKFRPNLQRIRVVLPDGGIRRLRVATSVIKKGKVTIPFKGKMITIPIEKATRGRNKQRLTEAGLWKDPTD